MGSHRRLCLCVGHMDGREPELRILDSTGRQKIEGASSLRMGMGDITPVLEETSTDTDKVVSAVRRYICYAAWYIGSSERICHAADQARGWGAQGFEQRHQDCGWALITPEKMP